MPRDRSRVFPESATVGGDGDEAVLCVLLMRYDFPVAMGLMRGNETTYDVPGVGVHWEPEVGLPCIQKQHSEFIWEGKRETMPFVNVSK